MKELLKHNAKVYLAARNRDTAHAVIDNLKQETGKEAIYIPLDLTDFQSIRKAAEDFLAKEEALHVLFNNACALLDRRLRRRAIYPYLTEASCAHQTK